MALSQLRRKNGDYSKIKLTQVKKCFLEFNCVIYIYIFNYILWLIIKKRSFIVSMSSIVINHLWKEISGGRQASGKGASA